jgi:hypothetical protein
LLNTERTNGYLGLGLVAAGFFFLAANLGFVHWRFQWWPLFILIPGMALLLPGLTRVSGLTLPGVIVTGVCGFFLLWSNRLLPFGMGFWWPIFPTIVGVAFLVFALQIQSMGVAIPGFIVGGVGAIFFAINLSHLTTRTMGPWWPLLIIVAGLSLYARGQKRA